MAKVTITFEDINEKSVNVRTTYDNPNTPCPTLAEGCARVVQEYTKLHLQDILDCVEEYLRSKRSSGGSDAIG
jgi:hypothetical protein